MDVKSLAAGYRGEMVEKLGKLVSINSERGETAADAPFGEGPKKALDTALAMMQADGFKVRNLDNYAGYAEMGEGDGRIDIIAHLDVVPASMEDGWDSDPFQMIEKDGILYGRGVSDDKGAAVASMIAMKILRDLNVPLTKRIRLVLGTNEETGSKGLEYYASKEGAPDYGFTPDGDFPCICGEKGMIGAVYRSKKTAIHEIKGGTAGNIVCKKCYAVVDKCSFSKKTLEDYFNNHNIEFELEENDANTVKLTVHGVAAHASTPELGVNAISYLFSGLKEAGFQDPFVDFFCDRIGLHTDGEGLGLNVSDDYGALTLNCGVIGMKDGVIEGTIDTRFPVTMNARQVMKGTEGRLEDDGGIIILNPDGRKPVEPLFFSAESPLVSCLTDAYREVTGDTESQPLVIGGGTYAKEIDNTIAFGCAFPGKDYKIHNANEWCPVDDLLKQVEIYVAGIEKLLQQK